MVVVLIVLHHASRDLVIDNILLNRMSLEVKKSFG